MIAPDTALREFIDDVKSGSIKDLEGVKSALESIHAIYKEKTWDWTTKLLSDVHDLQVSEVRTEQLTDLINQWESSSVKLDKMILSDAGKEFDNTSKIGFGIDGDAETADLDFQAVRGTIEDNKFTAGLEQEMEKIAQKATVLRDMLNKI